LGATTLNEYRERFEKDLALARRFQPVTLKEPNIRQAIKILRGLKLYYEDHHKIKITDKAIRAAVTLSSQYIQSRYLPDKAIDLIDEASSKIRFHSISNSEI
jgi:ATP-dependent Clp protease ATP-binding subunit ClpC